MKILSIYYNIRPNIGDYGYKIGISIVYLDKSNRSTLAMECYGSSFSSYKKLRNSDMI